MTKSNLALIESFKRGYRVINGQVVFNGSALSLHKNADGYSKFSIRFFGKVVPISVHRLLAYQKYGEAMFEKGIEVRHLDSNRANNLDHNIVIGTHSQNMMDMPKEQRRIKASIAGKKFDHNQVITFYKGTRSYKKTMNEFGIGSKGTLNFILRKSMAQDAL